MVYNFSAGPALLPAPVYARAAEAIHELRMDGHAHNAPGTGMSILEISHRSKAFGAILQHAQVLCHEVLGIPRTHQVLFLQGGASLQFTMVPMNLAHPDKFAAYIDTGSWATKAINESQIIGDTRVIASASDTGYDRVPQFPTPNLYAGASYLHLTTNETIQGVEYPDVPAVAGDVPVVIDFSSHAGSRPMSLERATLGYAGAQKNLGPSGVTLVYVHKDVLARAQDEHIPMILRYQTHAKEPSVYNTPNTFGVLVLQLVLEWMRDEGGLAIIAERNTRKATKLYELLDGSTLYRPHAQVGSRSQMNVTWRLAASSTQQQEQATKRFLEQATLAGFDGLQGHRTVGGCRASIYNAFPERGVTALCEFMREFERRA